MCCEVFITFNLEKLHISLATKMRKVDIGISGKNMFGKLANILLV